MIITTEKFNELWKAEEKENTYMVYNSDGISVIAHGETEANQLAEYMTRYHNRQFTARERNA